MSNTPLKTGNTGEQATPDNPQQNSPQQKGGKSNTGPEGNDTPKTEPTTEPTTEPKTEPKAEPTTEPTTEPKPKTESFRLKVFKFESTDPPAEAPESPPADDATGEGTNEDEGGKNNEGQTDDSQKNDSQKSDSQKNENDTKGSDPKPPNRKLLTTIVYRKSSEEFQKTTLTDVRKKVAPVMSEAFRFCDTSGAITQDKTTLASYLDDLGVKKIKPKSPIDIYVVPFKRPKTSAADLLDNPPFVLKFVQKLKEDEVQKESTLHSSTLPKVGGGKIKLKEIRKYVKAMSASASRHQFCLQDGHTVDDEVTLKEYVASLDKTVEEDGTPQATPSIEIYFTKPGAIKKSKSKGASDEIKDHPNLKPGDLTLRDLEAFNAKRDTELKEVKEELDAANFKLEGGEDDAKAAGVLTEDEWAIVIRNCNLMFGWVVDANNNKVVRAPKAGRFIV
ncbi:hypothetical protein FRC09_015127 [Ceratobasidium sp. 395]|nr:hypothetical protein FRC09_015127 [Ceratobasidium sp. 395]